MILENELNEMAKKLREDFGAENGVARELLAGGALPLERFNEYVPPKVSLLLVVLKKGKGFIKRVIRKVFAS